VREKQGPHDSRISQLRAKIVAKRVASQIKGQRDTREAYKAVTLQKLYELRTWEAILQTGDCGCSTRFPSWESADAEYQEKYGHLPQADQTQARLSIRGEQRQLAPNVEAICREQGNW
jgi:hypothetical protein